MFSKNRKKATALRLWLFSANTFAEQKGLRGHFNVLVCELVYVVCAEAAFKNHQNIDYFQV
jgi:hypothetical protein